MARTSKHWFYATIEWFEPAEQPESSEHLPLQLEKAKALIIEPKSLSAGLELLTQYVASAFIPTNLSNYEELFATAADADFVEIMATKVRVVGADWSSSPLPKLRAEAAFEIQVTGEFARVSLEKWQESNSPFWDAVIFSWNFEDNPSTEDLDLTMGNHLGMECVPVRDYPF